ncbi:MAG: SpoIIE family protein phosphatase [Clostridia bacterium]
MSIKKRVRAALIYLSLGAIIILMFISIVSFFSIRENLINAMKSTGENISTDNTKEMLSLSIQLAESTAQLNARRINGDFARIKGELLTLSGDIQNLYNGNGLKNATTATERYKEYIVSQNASISKEEIDKTLAQLTGITAMFDNVLANEDKISLAYMVLSNGMVFSSSNTFYQDVEKADMRTRDWYKNTVSAGKIHWSELYSGTDGRSYVTIAIPFYHDGQILGVVAFDLRVSEISEVVLNREDAGFLEAFIMTDTGKVLLSTEEIAKTTESEAYLAVINNVDFTLNHSGCYNSGKIIAGYANIEETGWKLVSLLDYNKVLEPVKKVETTVSKASASMQNSMTKQIFDTIKIFVLFLALLIFLTTLVSQTIAKKITKPVELLTAGATEIGDGNLSYMIPDLGKDEIGKLAQSFNSMSKKLCEYIENLTAVTIEKERIGAELDVARHIQASMLPCIFPPFPERPELDIYATMTPAKEVGGDFYDFFLVDDDHLVIVMADVSGKGVPAALFMVIAKTLLKNCAQTGLSPKEILEKVNNQLCENNDAELFVTVWLGIFEISTGKLIAANAGHEYPVLKRIDDDYELIKDKHGFVLAGMDGVRYNEYELQLAPGDKLYLYTDGVTEATNAQNELYGIDRMLTALNSNKKASSYELLHLLKVDIDAFVGEAPQFDDITMLALERKEAGGIKKLRIKPILESMETVMEFVERELEAANVPIKVIMQMNIAADEIFSNIARYSKATDATIGVIVQDCIVRLRFADNGLQYDPTQTGTPDTLLSADEREPGGLGVFMVKKFMNSLDYEYKDGLNILTLTKNLA